MIRKKLIIAVLLCLLSAQAVQAAPAFGFFGEVFSGIKSFFGFGDEDSKEAPPTIPPPDLGEVNPPLTPEELGPISVKDIPPPELLEESEEDVANKQKAVDQLGALTASVGQVLDLRHNPDIDLFDALFDIKKRLGDVKETFSCPEGYYMIIKGDDCPIVSEGQLKKAFDRMDEVVDSLGEDLSSPGVNDLLDGSDSYFRVAHNILANCDIRCAKIPVDENLRESQAGFRPESWEDERIVVTPTRPEGSGFSDRPIPSGLGPDDIEVGPDPIIDVPEGLTIPKPRYCKDAGLLTVGQCMSTCEDECRVIDLRETWYEADLTCGTCEDLIPSSGLDSSLFKDLKTREGFGDESTAAERTDEEPKADEKGPCEGMRWDLFDSASDCKSKTACPRECSTEVVLEGTADEKVCYRCFPEAPEKPAGMSLDVSCPMFGHLSKGQCYAQCSETGDRCISADVPGCYDCIKGSGSRQRATREGDQLDTRCYDSRYLSAEQCVTGCQAQGGVCSLVPSRMGKCYSCSKGPAVQQPKVDQGVAIDPWGQQVTQPPSEQVDVPKESAGGALTGCVDIVSCDKVCRPISSHSCVYNYRQSCYTCLPR